MDILEEEFVRIANDLIDAAQDKGITLRAMGAVAVYMHSSPEARELLTSLERLGKDKKAFTDLDVAGYSSQIKQIREFFISHGFEKERGISTLTTGRREVFIDKTRGFAVDIFLDKLSYCHEVPFYKNPRFGEKLDRLKIDYPTISLADLMLEKLQIIEINKKDLVDINVLLFGHEISDHEEKDKINAAYIKHRWDKDKGFYKDGMINLEKTRQYLDITDIGKNYKDLINERRNKLIEIVKN